MMTIVCVYDDDAVLNQVLRRSLERQTARHELILLDNRNGRYTSAAKALNEGGRQAGGDYILFAHPDLWLASDTALADIERTLRSLPDLGVAGFLGASAEGRTPDERRRWSLGNFGDMWPGRPVTKPEPVQTVDECALIVSRRVFADLEFDAAVFDGWQCYGADYCLRAAERGLKCYVIPSAAFHSSPRRNTKDLILYQERLLLKHRTRVPRIFTELHEISSGALRGRRWRRTLTPLYLRLCPEWETLMKRELAGCQTALDLGCGYHSIVKACGVAHSVGVERFDPYIEESRRRGNHDQFVQADVRRVAFKPRSFDAVVSSEVLEHLNTEEGLQLLENMTVWARRKVILTTPNGFVWQGVYDDNPLQEHLSAWTAPQLKRLGFRLYGMNGLKMLRGHKAMLRFKPVWFWEPVSVLSQAWVYHWPQSAFHLFAVKDVKPV